jgi:hypothetical protein
MSLGAIAGDPPPFFANLTSKRKPSHEKESFL